MREVSIIVSVLRHVTLCDGTVNLLVGQQAKNDLDTQSTLCVELQTLSDERRIVSEPWTRALFESSLVSTFILGFTF